MGSPWYWQNASGDVVGWTLCCLSVSQTDPEELLILLNSSLKLPCPRPVRALRDQGLPPSEPNTAL